MYRSSGSGCGPVAWLAVILAFFALGVGINAAIMNPDSARKAVESAGYQNVKVTGKSFLFAGLQGCAEEDSAIIHLEGTMNDRLVRVDVCQGMFKNNTLRYP